MESEWMGRYRGFISELVRHANIEAKALNTRHNMSGVPMSAQEWQVLEYIVEHRDDDDRMIFISEKLQIPQSTFSKIIKYLAANDLVEKYQMKNNRKNIFLKPSEFGIQTYNKGSEALRKGGFMHLFASLDCLSDDVIETFTSALHNYNDSISQEILPPEEDNELVKIK